jgi:hypothetical protein
MKASHVVISLPGEDIFSVLRRWDETKPSDASDCMFIRFDHASGCAPHGTALGAI